ncbi:helix-turn-helix domain-containing protein [Chryseobacterium sp. SIMBA_029]|uniref:helix-turn-helix domain-containing protein n=1 Tax=Chryseobacterium sp. SIMBA_029 TaxID=3085772 RepID=UPI0039789778
MLRLTELFRVLKAYYSKSEPFSFQIPFTRQQLSSITALRLETVIRTVKKMEKNKMVRIINGKIFY